MWIYYFPMTFQPVTLASIDDPCLKVMITLEVVKQWFSTTVIPSTFNWYCSTKRLSFAPCTPRPRTVRVCVCLNVYMYTLKHNMPTCWVCYKVLSLPFFFLMFKLLQVWPLGAPWSWLLCPFEHFLVFWHRKMSQVHFYFPCLRPTISYFSKILCPYTRKLYLETKIWMLGATYCSWSSIASMLFQGTELKNNILKIL